MILNLMTFLALLSATIPSLATPIEARGEGITVKFDIGENTAFRSSADPDNPIWGSRSGRQASIAWKDEEAQTIPQDEHAYQNFTLQFLKPGTTISYYDLKCQARINSEYAGGKRYDWVRWNFPNKMKDDSGNDDKLAIACSKLVCHIDDCGNIPTWGF